MKSLKTVKVRPLSFSDIHKNKPLEIKKEKLWQVLCGDKGHWRVGLYSPEVDSIEAIDRFEKHSCPEFFVLLSGNMSLVIRNKKKPKIIKLEPLKPVMIDTWHSGFCPNGKHTGIALVVERDEFITKYQSMA
ncbi:MAG: hypothetical protein NTY22_04120 [Proteobacteria bacterium]|nr:hypothetical protein [Pseudomonadota bacterium]